MNRTAQDVSPRAGNFALRFRAAVSVVDGAGATTAGVAADEEGEVASQEGPENHDAAADDGEVGFDNYERGGCGDVPGAVDWYVEEDGHVVGAYGGEDACSVIWFGRIREIEFSDGGEFNAFGDFGRGDMDMEGEGGKERYLQRPNSE